MKTDFLADTNVLIDLLEGKERILPYSDKLFAISIVSEIELCGKPGITQAEDKIGIALLNTCVILGFNEEIKNVAITLKQKKKCSLSDAIITATALTFDLPVLTSDKDFRKISGVDLVLIE